MTGAEARKVGTNGSTVKTWYRQAVKASEKTGETVDGSLKAFARRLAKDNPEGPAARWLEAKEAHRPRQWHRDAVKVAKAEGRRAWARKSSKLRRAAKAKAAK